MPFEFKKLDIPDLILIKPKVFNDNRGFFLESYKRSDFSNNGISEDFNQDNMSLSKKGTLRGLHYQLPPRGQSKLIRVIKGRVLDVAIDIRKSSPTFKQYAAVELSDENALMLYIPQGFAHGFLALCDDVILSYKCSREYSPLHEGGVRFDDSNIGIKWPQMDYIISDKDKSLPYLSSADIFS